MSTLIAIHKVRNMAPKYKQVAMIRPFSNIFLACAKGPIKNIVLHRTWLVNCVLKNTVHIQYTMLLLEAHLAMNNRFASVYNIANLTGIKKKTLDCMAARL